MNYSGKFKDTEGNIFYPHVVKSDGSFTAQNGYLKSVINGKTVQIGSQNSSYCHYTTDADYGHWFDKSVRVKGDVYGGTGYNRRLLYSDELTQKILWEDVLYMSDGHRANLSEAVSKQKQGIILVFSGYSSGPQNYNWCSYFISKKEVELTSGNGHFFTIGGSSGIEAFKYLYIYDTYIKGNANNVGTKTNRGISYDNSKAVLRYVIGI